MNPPHTHIPGELFVSSGRVLCLQDELERWHVDEVGRISSERWIRMQTSITVGILGFRCGPA
jgi:hypothetical protein